MKFEFNPNLSKEELVKGVVELYCYYFRECRRLCKGYEDSETLQPSDRYLNYIGASDAIGAVALQVLGGQQLYRLWEELVNEPSEDDFEEDPEA